MANLFTNNASTTLASPITNVATTLTVATGDGAKFPNPTGGDYFKLVLNKVISGIEYQWEITHCTARSGDILTITRAQEGTTAAAYAAGDPVSLRATAGTMSALVDLTSTQTLSGKTLTSPTLNTPTINGRLSSTSASVTAAGTNQGTGTALTSDINVITTAAAGTGVVLPTAAAGKNVIVVNKGANPVTVYPATGAAIDALATNAGFLLQVNGLIEFSGSSATQWYSSNNSVTSRVGDANGNPAVSVTTTASAVNYANVTNAATGNAVQLGATGSDTDVSLNLTTKGAGTVQVNGVPLSSGGGVAVNAAAVLSAIGYFS